jgi:hypothetical protein
VGPPTTPESTPRAMLLTWTSYVGDNGARGSFGTAPCLTYYRCCLHRIHISRQHGYVGRLCSRLRAKCTCWECRMYIHCRFPDVGKVEAEEEDDGGSSETKVRIIASASTGAACR